jgi:methionyl-tRNA formyltransferase
VSYAPRLERAAGLVDWTLPAAEIERRWRAYTPWPGLWARLGGQPLKIVRGAAGAGDADGAAPGTLLGLRDGRLAVACAGGTLFDVDLVQRPGRRALGAADFAHGERLRGGERFD